MLPDQLGAGAQSRNQPLQQVLEGANIKLASVATDVLGLSGRAMLQSLAAGETNPQVLAALAKRRLRAKRAALVAALDGVVGAHQHFLLGMQLRRLQSLETELARLDAEVARRVRLHQAVLTAVAVAHSIAVILHHIIKTRQLYVDLGHHYFEQRDQAALTRRAVRQLEHLGHTVTIQAT